MYIESENAYKKLLLDEKVQKDIVIHPFFKNAFIREYDLYLDSHRNMEPTVIVNDVNGISNIILKSNVIDKNATNGVYVGVYSDDSCTFSFQELDGKKYLGINRKEDFQYRIPANQKSPAGNGLPYDLVCTTLRTSMSAFDELEQTGYVSFIIDGASKEKILGTPSDMTVLPVLSIPNAITGSVVEPLKVKNSNYKMDSIFRSREYFGLVEYWSKVKMPFEKQNGGREVIERRVLDIDHNNPKLLDNVHLFDPIAYQHMDSRLKEENATTFSDPAVIKTLQDKRLENVKKYYNVAVPKTL